MAPPLGFTGIAVGDHVAFPLEHRSSHPFEPSNYPPSTPFLDPFISIAAMAAVTSRLRFTTYIYVLPMRNPFSDAKQVGTAAMVSNYRVALGAGAGWLEEEIELLGHPAAGRGTRTEEMLQVIRDLWGKGTAEFHGESPDFDPVAMYPVPERHICELIARHSAAGWCQPAARVFDDGRKGRDARTVRR